MTTTPSDASVPSRPTLYRYEMPNGQSPSWEASDFGDDWETLTVQDIRDLLTPLYEDIRTADVAETIEGTGAEARRVVTFKQKMRTKGALATTPPRPDAGSLTAADPRPDAPGPGTTGDTDRDAPPRDPRPLLLWRALAQLPALELRCYKLAYDMQHRSLDDLLAEDDDTLELVMEQTERELAAVARLTEHLIPAPARAARDS